MSNNNPHDKFQTLVENSFISTYVIKKGIFVYTNKKFSDVFGWTQEEMLHKPSKDLIHPDDVQLVMNKLKERAETIGLGIEYTFRGLHKNGSLIDIKVYGSSFLLDGEKAVIGMLVDETQTNLGQKELVRLANYDTLTGLFNRNYFNTQLNHAINLAKRNNKQVALLLFDIDNFKRVNDSLGHNAGDKVIQNTAERISKLLRETDTFCRIGGDEFTVIIEHCHDTANLVALLQRIHKEMDKSIIIDKIPLHISLSIGVSLYPKNAQDMTSLQKTADVAMYEAKQKGKRCTVFYHEDSKEKLELVELEDEIFKALEKKEFELYLQPQIDTIDEKLIGAEALIRWNHPTKGIIPPDKFLSLAEEIGLLYKIDLFMLFQALSILQDFKKTNHLFFTISVNISNALFLHPNFLKEIRLLHSHFKEESKFIQLELTEHIIMENQENTLNLIRELKGLGFRLSIDDFGTGYSSLSHLKILNVDELKIDKSFIDDIVFDKTSKSIVTAIINMSKALNLTTVAEGVEDEQQLKLLQELGCDLIQGYFYSKPLQIQDFKLFTKNFF